MDYLKHVGYITLVVLFVFGLIWLENSRLEKAKAEPQHEYVFFKDTNFTESIPIKWSFPKIQYGYIWKDAPEYKNERLLYYQHALRTRGITDPEQLKYFTAHLIIENGAMNEHIDGDSGCSVGIPQRYVCQFGYSAKSFRKKYPEWNDWKRQLDWMADYTVQNFQKLGDVRLTIIYHNSPQSALSGRDACHISPCYYQRVKNTISLLQST